jgi:RNA polymerase sigma-70 factor, ECF subfamily
MTPTKVVALNRAVAIGERDGPEVALMLIEALEFDSYYLWHASRAEMLARLGRYDESVAAYMQALQLTANRAEQAFLNSKVRQISGAEDG